MAIIPGKKGLQDLIKDEASFNSLVNQLHGQDVLSKTGLNPYMPVSTSIAPARDATFQVHSTGDNVSHWITITKDTATSATNTAWTSSTDVYTIKRPVQFVVAPAKMDIDADGGEAYYPVGKAMFDTILRGLLDLNLEKSWKGRINLHDGTKIIVHDNGRLEIQDKDAKVTYRANRDRDFNRYLNASDLMEEFIRFMGSQGIPQELLLNLPVELFINFLIIRAAEQDEAPEEAEGIELIPSPLKLPKCRHCGKFIPKRHIANGIEFCDDTHLLLFMRKKDMVRSR